MVVAEADRTWEELRAEGAVLEAARRRFAVFVKVTFPEYVFEPVHRYVAGELQRFVEACRRGESPRLMIFMHPQVGKSELVSRRLPPWILGSEPDWWVLLLSYSDEWAWRLSGDARRVVRSAEYGAVFGPGSSDDPTETVEIDPLSKSVKTWGVKGRRGGLHAAGINGQYTGYPAHVLVLDDTVKGREEADSEVERATANSKWPQIRNRVQKGGGIIVTTTRWHTDDVPGHVLRLSEADPNADQWRVVNLRAFAPERGDPMGRVAGEPLAPGRFDTRELLALKASMPARDWAALYEGEPTDAEGNIFRAEWWREEPLARANPRRKYLFGDLAFSRHEGADYTVFGVWSREDGPVYRLLDVYRARLTLPEARRVARALAKQHGVRFAVVEKKGRTDEEFEAFSSGLGVPVLWYTPSKDKVKRAHAVTPMLAAGQVILPSENVPWKTDYLVEHAQFPQGRHDDQVDCTTMALLVMSGQEKLRRTGLRMLDFRMVAA